MTLPTARSEGAFRPANVSESFTNAAQAPASQVPAAAQVGDEGEPGAGRGHPGADSALLVGGGGGAPRGVVEVADCRRVAVARHPRLARVPSRRPQPANRHARSARSSIAGGPTTRSAAGHMRRTSMLSRRPTTPPNGASLVAT